MLDLMKTFVAVVEHQSLNRAARVLNLSQPALSRKIGGLEAALGVTLFERRGKRLVLTEVGETCLHYAREFLRLEQRLLGALAEHGPARKHRLVIGASLTTLQSCLPDFIALLQSSGVPLEISAITGKTHEIVRYVQENRADLGLVASSVHHDGLVCVPLFEDHLVLAVPGTHELCRRERVPITALDDLPMILFSKGTWYRVLMDELFERHGLRPQIRMEIDSFEAILRLIGTLHLAALLPASYLKARDVADDGMRVIQIEELKAARRTTCLIYSRDREFPSDLRRAIDQAAERLAAGAATCIMSISSRLYSSRPNPAARDADDDPFA